jgi:hypothetical protein
MTDLVPDVLPKLVIELRADGDVAAIAGANPSTTTVRVRGGEPGPSDAQPKGSFRAFVVLVQLDAPRMPRVPIQRPQIVARCYGRDFAEAAALRWACSNAIHNVGPRVHSNDLGIYNSLETTGGEQESDPITKQPYQSLFIEALATTQVAAVVGS